MDKLLLFTKKSKNKKAKKTQIKIHLLRFGLVYDTPIKSEFKHRHSAMTVAYDHAS